MLFLISCTQPVSWPGSNWTTFRFVSKSTIMQILACYITLKRPTHNPGNKNINLYITTCFLRRNKHNQFLIIEKWKLVLRKVLAWTSWLYSFDHRTTGPNSQTDREFSGLKSWKFKHAIPSLIFLCHTLDVTQRNTRFRVPNFIVEKKCDCTRNHTPIVTSNTEKLPNTAFNKVF
jgi:hypothetical protein